MALLVLEGSPASGVRGTDGGLAARTGHLVMKIQQGTGSRSGYGAMLGRDLLKLASNVLELVQLGVGVIAGRGGGLGLGIEGIRLWHVLLVLTDGCVDYRIRPDALGVLARWRSIPLPVALLLVMLLQLLLVAQSRVLLKDVRSGLSLIHGTVFRLRITAVAGRCGARSKALPLDALVVQRLTIEGEHSSRTSGFP